MRPIAPLLCALALLPPCPAQAAGKAQRSYVVIVANNRSLTPGVAPLRYADDDGALWYELLSPLAARISLFSVLDEESQRLFRTVVPRAEAPTRAALLARLGEYNAEMERARAEGAEPVLYVVVVGHGEVAPDGEGYVSLLDAPLRRADLFRDVIAPSKAAYNHLIIDACNAYLLVQRRGPDDRGPSAAGEIRRYLAEEDLERFPTTGVLLSTSRAQATHEWSVYGGGVFSHQLRSALTGAADVNADGRIEYSEVRAYIAAANLRVDDPRARLDIFVRAPALDRGRPLLDLSGAGFTRFLRVPATLEGHYFLEDARGVRFADFNKSGERPLLVALVDSTYYFLRSDSAEARLRLEAGGTIDLRPELLARRATATRGAIEETFRRDLFKVPFGPAFYRGFVANEGGTPVTDPPDRAFVPPVAQGPAAVSTADLERRVDAARDRIQRVGLLRGDDPYCDQLLGWADGRLGSGDLREAQRAIAALERRLSDLVVDHPLVVRKMQRARQRIGDVPASIGERVRRLLDEAIELLERDNAPAANRATNEALVLLGG